MSRSIALALVLVSSFAVPVGSNAQSAAVTASEREALVGHWYGEDYQPVLGARTRWLQHRRADGTFTILFKPNPPGRPQTEEGTWERKGSLYSTRTTAIDGIPTDPDDPQYYDDYELEKVAADLIVYTHKKQKIRFQSRRVRGDYRIP